ncbi:hypothetical protein BJ741DRAFT_606892 [Chytriomyces cf. hyalinus JEL632]|nr:hypothetical protein BJ741DRAFT_606892 [Chytriomyces cf. hyalinus JEL632]
MCYVKVKTQPQALPIAVPSPAKELTPDAFNLDNFGLDPLDANTEWLSMAMGVPLVFSGSVGVGAPAVAGETDADWMSWLEGMSQVKPDISDVSVDLSLPNVFSPLSPALTLTSPSLSAHDSAYASIETKKRSFSSETEALKRLKTCPPESEDQMKRLKNTEAARKSRARKAAKVDSLEHRVDTLESEKAGLAMRVAVLESDAASFTCREADLKRRVAMLEAQLAESHRALISQAL